MEGISLSDGEWKLMNLLWDEAPLTMGRMVDSMRAETGWTKSTVSVMLRRLAEKGAVRVDPEGPRKLYYPLIRRDDAVRQEARSTLKKIRMDRIGLLVSTMAEETDLSPKDIDELIGILKGVRGDD